MKINLKQILKAYNVTQKELASVFKVSQGAISNYVNNRRTMSAEQIKTLAKYLNVTVDYLYQETSDDNF